MMQRSLVLFSCLVIAACGDKAPDATTPPTAAGGHTDDGHGPEQKLGSMTIGAHTFEVVQAGDVAAGKEAAFDLVFAAGKPVPSTVRAWIGVESAEGSVKAKLGKEGDHTLHEHVQVPKAIPAGSKLWVEIEEGGKTDRKSIAWK